jgi:hypothetical protein
MPLQLRDKSDFIPELTINTQRLWAKSVSHPFLPLAIRWSLRSDPNPRSSILKLKPSMADQNQAVQVNLIPLRSIRYYFFDPRLRFLPLFFPDRLNPLSFWFPSRIIHHLIFSDLWESPTPLSLLKPNPTEYPSNRLYQDLMRGKTPSKTGPCPQLQAGEIGTRGYLKIKVSKPAIGIAFASPSVWSYL